MSEMIKKDALLNFIERLNVYQIVYQQPFLTLYPEWFKEVSIDLENEIHENLLITNIQKESYLSYIKKRILEDIPFESHKKIIDKWVETYALEDLKFPYLDHKEIKILIASSLDGDYLSQKEKHLYKEIQIDFYCHAAIIEKYRILDFINDLLKTDNDKPYKKQVWFKVGILLASGKMSEYYTDNSDGIMCLKNSYTAPIIAKELGDKKYEKVVLATLQNYGPDNTNANKNIFNSRDKMMKIIEHCEDNNITVISHFKDRLPKE